MAKSHIPAYGLMQIVPRSAGKDATKHLYGKAKILAPSYLYGTENNINVGSAYLHVLYYKYLRKVKDPKSRIYCAIAAYNTGASNVARAFIRKKNFNKAVKRINKMTSGEVYQALIRRLPFRETRRYVKKVANNMEKYL
jgi:membrane-bound lytic murein transglycosylase C